MLKAVFIFIAPKANPEKHRSEILTQEVHLITIGVDSYETAISLVDKLIEEDVSAIELCGGFGNIGTAKIAEKINGRAALGVVRFDVHPGLNCKSGDEFF